MNKPLSYSKTLATIVLFRNYDNSIAQSKDIQITKDANNISPPSAKIVKSNFKVIQNSLLLAIPIFIKLNIAI